MRSSRAIHVVSAHAAGEVGDVIVGGVAPPPGETLWDQRRYLAEDGALRDFMLNEPRGGVFRHVNLLVPPKHPDAQAGFLIMEPADTPPMSGSNAICVATVLLETGIVAMQEPETRLVLEAPGGLVHVRAACAEGRVSRISVENLPAFALHRARPLDVPGLGKITIDTAWGGDSFVVADAEALGLDLRPGNARALARLGIAITNAANAALTFEHPERPDWRHHSFCLFSGPVKREGTRLTTTSVTAIQPGKIDRSPTGTALSARMALLHGSGEMSQGDTLTARSLIGTEFEGRILGATTVGVRPAIRPEISGRAWITGTHQHLLDPEDPFPRGYRLSDTWPDLGGN